MTEIHEMSDAELMDFAETWLNLELRRIPTKLGLTPTQMSQVLLRCSDRFLNNYFKELRKEEEEEANEG